MVDNEKCIPLYDELTSEGTTAQLVGDILTQGFLPRQIGRTSRFKFPRIEVFVGWKEQEEKRVGTFEWFEPHTDSIFVKSGNESYLLQKEVVGTVRWLLAGPPSKQGD